MHPSALSNGKLFFSTYVQRVILDGRTRLLELGSLNVNGSLRDVAPKEIEYIGVDITAGSGVDLVVDKASQLPFEDVSFDIVVSSSCFEHSEFFWLDFLEIMRVLKPTGLFYLNAPSNGSYHRAPVDCWRFYPDSGVALANWARRNNINAVMLESFISMQTTGNAFHLDQWNDFVAVFLRDEVYANNYRSRMQDRSANFYNARRLGSEEISNFQEFTEDTLARLRINR